MITRKLRAYLDWIVLGIVLLLAVISAVVFLSLTSSTQVVEKPGEPQESRVYEIKPSGIQEIVPPAKEFPISGIQRGFYTIYEEGDLQYRIDRRVTNASRDPGIGTHKFLIEVRNTINKEAVVTGDLLQKVSIGCVALDKPYRRASFKTEQLTLKPFEVKSNVVDIDATCLYLGTADRQYFWRIY